MSHPRSETVLASAARTADVSTDVEVPRGAQAMLVVWDITAGAALSIVLTIQGRDPLSGKKWTILSSASQTGVATVTMRVGRGLPATANVSANEPLPNLITIFYDVSNATSATSSVAIHWSY